MIGICPDNAYHRLLHQRINAMKACGDPNKIKCTHCKEYDYPENMYVSPNHSAKYHRECNRLYEQKTRGLSA